MTGTHGPLPHRRLRAVILDWAGTHRTTARSRRLGLSRRSSPISASDNDGQARGPMGVYKLDHIRAIAAIPEVADRWQRVHGSACTEDDILAMYRELIPIQEQILPQFCDLIPGTVEAVNEIRARGYKIGSTTGYPRSIGEIAARRANRTGLRARRHGLRGRGSGRPPRTVDASASHGGDARLPSQLRGEGRRHGGGHRRGLNAGAWTVGITKTGNYVGLDRAEAAAMPSGKLAQLVRRCSCEDCAGRAPTT